MNGILSKFDLHLLSTEQITDQTRKVYTEDVKLFLMFLEQSKTPLLSVKLDTLSEYHKFMYFRDLKARTRARKILSLRKFFNYLHKEKEYPNWSSWLVPPPFEKPLPNSLTKKEMLALLKETTKGYSSHKKRNQLIVFLLYASGMRISELVKLKVMDIFFEQNIIRVFGKGSRERLIPIPSVCMDLVKKYVCKLDNEEYIFGVNYGNKKKHMSRQSAFFILKSIWKRTGNPKKIYPHLIRHSYASHMMNNGANIRQIQLLLGHERLESTQVYTHLTLDKIKDTYKSMHTRA
jgi:site-specific recombinase XerD